MSTVLIDYTSFSYSAVVRTPVPPVTSGKFVQVRHGDTLYLVLSPRELAKYHGNILERFCMDQGLEGSYEDDGGKFERDSGARAIRFHGDSTAYGRFDAELMRSALTGLPEFSGYRVVIE